MSTPNSNRIVLQGVLNSASRGLEIAQEVLVRLERRERVVIDGAGAERMTPSFSNALIFTLAEKVGLDRLRTDFEMSGCTAIIQQAVEASISRYERGIRLSTQPPASDGKVA